MIKQSQQSPGIESGTGERIEAALTPAKAERGASTRLVVQRVSMKYGLLVVFVLMTAFFWMRLPSFGTVRNLWVILESMAIVAVAAMGVTFSLAVGGFDLSIGSNVGFVLMVGAIAKVEFNWSSALTLVVAVGAGLLVGVINALLIVKGKIPDMIATLGTMFVFEGLALVIANGNNVAPGMVMSNGKQAPGHIGSVLNWIGNGTVGLGIPGLVVIMVGVAAVVFVVLERSRLGRSLFAVGLNTEAARLVGIRVPRLRAVAYLASGLLGGVAGVMLLGLLGQGQVNAGNPYLLECVAAALIGYAFFGMKRPSAHGTIFGSLFVAVVINGLTMFNIPYYAEDKTYGLLLIVALVLTYTLGGEKALASARRQGRQILRLARRRSASSEMGLDLSVKSGDGDRERAGSAVKPRAGVAMLETGVGGRSEQYE